jgi:anti-sigma factor RsiW
VNHPRQQLSALIDDELDSSERYRVVMHVNGCLACQQEVAALRAIKRRMNALGAAAAGAAFAGLTGRLMEQLSQLAPSQQQSGRPDPDQLRSGGTEAPADPDWPADPARQWQLPAQDGKSEQRAGRYFLAGSLAIFMAGLGTAAFIAGGEPQPSAPGPTVPPSVDVMVVPHEVMNGVAPTRRPNPSPSALHPALSGSLAHR